MPNLSCLKNKSTSIVKQGSGAPQIEEECNELLSGIAKSFSITELRNRGPSSYFADDNAFLKAQLCKERLIAKLTSPSAQYCMNYKTSWIINKAYRTRPTVSSDSSMGYSISDVNYATFNEPEISLSAALPSPLNFHHTDPQEKQNARKLWEDLLYGNNKLEAEQNIARVLSQKQAEHPDESWYSGFYSTKLTLGVGPTVDPKYKFRFVTLKKTPDCLYLANFIPTAEKGKTLNSAAVHSICERPRLNSQREKLSFLYNWRVSQPDSFDYGVKKADDGNCHECHSGKSSFIALDVDPNLPQSRSMGPLLQYLASSWFTEKAPAASALNTGDNRIFSIFMPLSSTDLPAAFSLDPKESEQRLKNRSNFFGTHCNVNDPQKQEQISKEMDSCGACHNGFRKSMAEHPVSSLTRRAIRSPAAIIPLISSPHHPWGKYHERFSPETFVCLWEEQKKELNEEAWKTQIAQQCDHPEVSQFYPWLKGVDIAGKEPNMDTSDVR